MKNVPLQGLNDEVDDWLPLFDQDVVTHLEFVSFERTLPQEYPVFMLYYDGILYHFELFGRPMSQGVWTWPNLDTCPMSHRRVAENYYRYFLALK